MTIYLLTIAHRHGIDHWACASREIAQSCLYNYVCDWWEESWREEEPILEIPAGRDEAIGVYFEKTQELRPEWWSIDDLPLLDTVDEGD